MRKTKSLLSLLLAVAMACTLVIPAAAVDTGQTNTSGSAVLSVAETGDGTFTVSLDPNSTDIACVQFTVNDTGLTVADAQPETDADFAYHGYGTATTGSNTYAAAGRDTKLTETTALLTITAAGKTADEVTAAITPVAAYKVNGTDTVDVAVVNGDASSGDSTYQKGDVNMDGSVNSDDATALLRHIARIELLPSDEAIALGDVTGDSATNSDDATKLLRYIARIITSLD